MLLQPALSPRNRLLNLIAPSTDQPHRPRPSNHLSYSPLVFPGQSRLRSCLDLSHLCQVATDQIGVDSLVKRIYRQDVERIGLSRFGCRRTQVRLLGRFWQSAEQRVRSKSGWAVGLLRPDEVFSVNWILQLLCSISLLD